jgi:hypothetical protein
MDVTGGLYLELCCVPRWQAVFGSGGRAAAAISSVAKHTVLHTYVENPQAEGVRSLERLGVEVRATRRERDIAFAYFHSLSRPHVEPPLHTVRRESSLILTAQSILRFGILEGDAIVHGERVVYDPQSTVSPEAFRRNGSTARALAVVLNEFELRKVTGLLEVERAARKLIDDQNASTVVVKMGVKGAAVFEKNRATIVVPPYRSSRIFKIGTGDIFSASFAYHWAEKRISAAKAADLASRAVASYCDQGGVPGVRDSVVDRKPIIIGASSGLVKLVGPVRTIGERYALEEATYVLRELGVEVWSPDLGQETNNRVDTLLVLSDGFESELEKYLLNNAEAAVPIVVLQEGQSAANIEHGTNTTVVNDFVSALYIAAWSAIEHAQEVAS